MAEFLKDLKRTHHCGDLREEHVGQTIVLMGWVQSYRDHGGTIFIDMRDRYGITQVRFDASVDADMAKAAERLRPEWTFGVQGTVVSRGRGCVNRCDERRVPGRDAREHFRHDDGSSTPTKSTKCNWS